jgi:hypothetical protein
MANNFLEINPYDERKMKEEINEQKTPPIEFAMEQLASPPYVEGGRSVGVNHVQLVCDKIKD